MQVNSICSYPFTTVRIYSNGGVYFCEYQRVELGNLFKSSFEEIWFGETAEQCRTELTKSNYAKNCCVDCPYYSSKQKDRQTVGYSEFPAILELFDETNETHNFKELLNKIKDYREVVIDFKHHNVISLPPVPVTMNLYKPVYHPYVTTYRIMQCDDFSNYKFDPEKKYICKYKFKLSQLNNIWHIMSYFYQHPFQWVECDIDTSEVTEQNCGLFKRAELIIRAKFPTARIVRPFDLRLAKKYELY